MRLRLFPLLLALAGAVPVWSLDISILDFRIKPSASKKVGPDDAEYLAARVRTLATGYDPSWRILSKETLAKILADNGKNYSECAAAADGACEVGVGQILQSDYHVVGDISLVGGKYYVLSVRFYDVHTSMLKSSEDIRATNVADLADQVDGLAQRLFSKATGKDVPAVVSRPAPTPTASVPASAPAPAGGRTTASKDGMVSIPAGCFMMGSPSGVGDGDEHPQHRVCLNGFSMDRTGVTNAAYRSSGSTPHYQDGSCYRYDGNSWTQGSVSSSFQGNDQPAVCVDWSEAKSYCESQGKRLPTEAEWEYAARAGTTTKWYWGDDEGSTGDYAWYSGNSDSQTHPAGQKRPNGWGLYDMAGNVWEWVNDWKGDYSSREQQNPSGPSSGSFRVNRGGGWFNDPGNLRSAYRHGLDPGYRGSHLGFRCVAP